MNLNNIIIDYNEKNNYNHYNSSFTFFIYYQKQESNQ